MRSVSFQRFNIVLISLIAVVGCSNLSYATDLTTVDITAVKQVSQDWLKGWKARDWDAVSKLYTEDGVILPPDGPAKTGRAAIKEELMKLPPTTNESIVDLEISGGDDFAVVRGTIGFTVVTESAMPVIVTGKFIDIRRKQSDGKWLLTRDIWNIDLPSVPPAPAAACK